jgi:hypothetical protein
MYQNFYFIEKNNLMWIKSICIYIKNQIIAYCTKYAFKKKRKNNNSENKRLTTVFAVQKINENTFK